MKRLVFVLSCLLSLATLTHAHEDVDRQQFQKQIEATAYGKMLISASKALNHKLVEAELPGFQKGEHGDVGTERFNGNVAELRKRKVPYPQHVTFWIIKNTEPRYVYECVLVRKHLFSAWTVEKVTKRKKTRADQVRRDQLHARIGSR